MEAARSARFLLSAGWQAVLSRAVPRLETKWPGSGKFAIKITSLETHLLLFSNPNFVKQDLLPRSETLDWVWWQPDEKRTALPSPCSPWTKYSDWRVDWGEECSLMSEKQHICANKFGLSELAKCIREILFLLGGGDGHHLQKNIEQYICFREQLIKEHVKRLY